MRQGPSAATSKWLDCGRTFGCGEDPLAAAHLKIQKCHAQLLALILIWDVGDDFGPFLLLPALLVTAYVKRIRPSPCVAPSNPWHKPPDPSEALHHHHHARSMPSRPP